MQPCHGETNQPWYFDEFALKTMHDDELCLVRDSKGNAVMGKCQDQQWQWEVKVRDRRLMNRYSNKCSDYHPGNGRVWMHPCHNGENQKWYSEGENCVPADDNGTEEVCTFELKSKFDNKCLDYSATDEYEEGVWWGPLLMLDCDGSPSQQWYLVGEELKTLSVNVCLDHITYKDVVWMYGCHGKKNQKWEWN